MAITASAVAGGILFESARRAKTKDVAPSEEKIFRLFNDAPERIHFPAWAVMQTGSLAAVFVVSLMLGCRGRIGTAAVAFLAGFSVWLGVKKAKPSIGRGRPSAHLDDVHVRGHAQTGLGYPSGHAAVALTLALIATKDCAPGSRAAALIAAGITGGARMYVGAHLPLDIAGGLSIGTLWGWAAIAVSRTAPSNRDS